MNFIILNRRELDRISELLNILQESGDYSYVELTQDRSSGIGNVLNAKFQITHKDIDGEFVVTITDVETW